MGIEDEMTEWCNYHRQRILKTKLSIYFAQSKKPNRFRLGVMHIRSPGLQRLDDLQRIFYRPAPDDKTLFSRPVAARDDLVFQQAAFDCAVEQRSALGR